MFVKVKGGLATPLLKDIQTHLGGDALNVKPQVGFLFTMGSGLKLMDIAARKAVFEQARIIEPNIKSMSLVEAILIYTKHNKIDTTGVPLKKWLYFKSGLGGDVANERKVFKANKKQKRKKVRLANIEKVTATIYNTVTTKTTTVSFYMQKPWRTLRAKVIKTYGCTCMRCGYRNTKNHVDHIYPRSKYPHLELEFCNLQVLRETCNSDKSNTAIYDMRPPTAKKWQDELKSKVKGFYHQPKLATN
jgi:5-methylcytosine-specific restriction endonuclease McrA